MVSVHEPDTDCAAHPKILLAKVNAIQTLADRGEQTSPPAMSLEKDIDEIVIGMYGISKHEERIIDEALDLRGNRFSRGTRHNVIDDDEDD